MEPEPGPTDGTAADAEHHAVVLKNGTPGIVRPIRPDGGAKLAAALARLSPESRIRRFFYDKATFTEEELFRLTHCDGVNHLAVVFAITNDNGEEIAPIGVARCFRKPDQPEIAEVSIAVADEWHGQGVGTSLLKELAARAMKAGIRKWQAVYLAGNVVVRKLMESVGVLESEEVFAGGAVSAIVHLGKTTPAKRRRKRL